MAITTYSELRTAVANWLERDDLSARIPEFIDLVESRIAQTIRVRSMETITAVVVNATTRSFALPGGYKQMRRIFKQSTANSLPMEGRNSVDFWSLYGNLPETSSAYFTIEGENISIAPLGSITQTFDVLYYKAFDTLSADTDTTPLLADAPGLYLYGGLLEAAPFLGNDPRVLIWAQMWDDLREKVQAADAYDRHSGDIRPSTSDVHVK